MTRHHDAAAGRPGARSLLLRGALIAGCAIMLTGCYSSTRPDVSAYAPSDYRLRHPIVVREKDHTVELLVGDSRGALTPEQRADVLAFAQAWRREATGGIVVMVPVGTRNAAAAGGVVREVQSIFAAVGIPANGVAMRSYRPPDPRRLATVKLNYPRMTAEAGPCGLWPSDIGPTTEGYRLNKPYWNHGCATQRNLAAMVANPADLVQPRGETPPYGWRRSVVIDAYRKGEQTSSKAPNNEAAKISDVGK
jgi:pilus assembly protein CpaD